MYMNLNNKYASFRRSMPKFVRLWNSYTAVVCDYMELVKLTFGHPKATTCNQCSGCRQTATNLASLYLEWRSMANKYIFTTLKRKFWRHFCRWQHQRCHFDTRFLVQPMEKILSEWHLRFSALYAILWVFFVFVFCFSFIYLFFHLQSSFILHCFSEK